MAQDHPERNPTIADLVAELAELRVKNAALHEQVAMHDRLSETLNDYADKGWSWLAVVDQERRQVDQLAAGLAAACEGGDAHAVARALVAIYRTVPAGARPHVIKVSLKRGPALKVPLGVVARLEKECRKRETLAWEICAMCGVSESTAWRAIKLWQELKDSDLTAVVDVDMDGRLEFVPLPRKG